MVRVSSYGLPPESLIENFLKREIVPEGFTELEIDKIENWIVDKSKFWKKSDIHTLNYKTGIITSDDKDFLSISCPSHRFNITKFTDEYYYLYDHVTSYGYLCDQLIGIREYINNDYDS